MRDTEGGLNVDGRRVHGLVAYWRDCAGPNFGALFVRASAELLPHGIFLIMVATSANIFN